MKVEENSPFPREIRRHLFVYTIWGYERRFTREMRGIPNVDARREQSLLYTWDKSDSSCTWGNSHFTRDTRNSASGEIKGVPIVRVGWFRKTYSKFNWDEVVVSSWHNKEDVENEWVDEDGECVVWLLMWRGRWTMSQITDNCLDLGARDLETWNRLLDFHRSFNRNGLDWIRATVDHFNDALGIKIRFRPPDQTCLRLPIKKTRAEISGTGPGTDPSTATADHAARRAKTVVRPSRYGAHPRQKSILNHAAFVYWSLISESVVKSGKLSKKRRCADSPKAMCFVLKKIGCYQHGFWPALLGLLLVSCEDYKCVHCMFLKILVHQLTYPHIKLCYCNFYNNLYSIEFRVTY